MIISRYYIKIINVIKNNEIASKDENAYLYLVDIFKFINYNCFLNLLIIYVIFYCLLIFNSINLYRNIL